MTTANTPALTRMLQTHPCGAQVQNQPALSRPARLVRG